MSEEQSKTGTVLILTYNDVEGFPNGVYGGGRLIVHSSDKRHFDKSASVMHNLLHQLYHRINPEDVDHVFVYVGTNAKSQALSAARQLAEESKITLVGCSCDKGEKEHFAAHRGIEFILCECGGDKTLGRIAKIVLGEAH